jgi:hypothetical protein
MTDPEIPITIYGSPASLSAGELDGNLKQTNENFSQDMDGIITATVSYIGPYSDVVRHGRASENHPTYDSLVRTNYGVQRMSAGLGTVTCTYKGCMSGDYFVRYSVESSAKAEPIQTHPFFKEGKDIPANSPDAHKEDEAFGYKFGGQVSGGGPNGSNQAFFESSGTAGGMRFRYFPKEAMYDLPGVTQYLDFSVVLKVIIVSHAPNDFKQKISNDPMDGGYIYAVGAKVDPPVDYVDTELFSEAKGGVDADYNWLVTSVTHEVIGSAFRQEVDFTLSGYLGWNGLLYRSDEKSGIADTRFDSSFL